MTKVHCNLPKYLWGEVNSYCYWIKKGKPAAVLCIKNEYVNKVQKYVQDVFRLCVYQESPGEEWTAVWIYEKPYVLEIIKKAPREPKSIFDEWILGKLFGYSDEAIEEFINRQPDQIQSCNMSGKEVKYPCLRLR